jgi:hypothetical protein
MDTILTLVKCITLLYRESTLPHGGEDSKTMIHGVVDKMKLPELTLTLNDERAQLTGLRQTVLNLCDTSQTGVIDKTDLLQRVKVNCTNNERAYDAIRDGVEPELDEAATKSLVVSIRRNLREAVRDEEITTLIKKANTDVGFNRQKIQNVRKYVSELIRQLEPYRVDGSGTKDPAIVGEINLAQPESINAALAEMQEVENEHGMLRTGWQGLNKMLQGGFRPGEEWVTPALQHRWKTGFSLSLFRQIAVHNTPVLIDPTKKPLLLRISTEDNLYSNIRFLYESIYFCDKKEMPDIKTVPVDEMAHLVKTTLEANGFHVRMIRVNPGLWSYMALQNYVLGLEAEGYEIKLCMVDYLPMIPTVGCEDGPAGTGLQDLYRRVRNFFSPRKTVVITPHQLSTDAKQLMRDGVNDFVKQLPGKGYYKGSKQIDQEVDGELFLHIETYNNRFYLTIQRGKHRGVPVIPETDQYMVLPFPLVGPIPDDYGDKRIDRKRVGGGETGSGEEVPFFDFG